MLDTILSLLTNPALISVIGPSGIVLLVVGFLWYRQYQHVLSKYEEVQEKRIQENQMMLKEYQEFSVDMTRTLDAVLDVVRKNAPTPPPPSVPPTTGGASNAVQEK